MAEPIEVESTQTGPPPSAPSVRMFLRRKDGEPRRPPSRLARLLGLHVFSEALLGKHARIEMNFAAVLLCVVALFELAAWSFTFNALFNGDIFHLGATTVPAVLVGALFACAVLWFERQFLTSDDVGTRRGWAATTRVVLILFAALINAQPLELLIFRKPVRERIHAEGIRESASVGLAEVEREESADAEDTKARSTLPAGDYLVPVQKPRIFSDIPVQTRSFLNDCSALRRNQGVNRAPRALRGYTSTTLAFRARRSRAVKREGVLSSADAERAPRD